MKFIKKNLFHKCDIIHVHATQISFIPEVWASPPPPNWPHKVNLWNSSTKFTFKPVLQTYAQIIHKTIKFHHLNIFIWSVKTKAPLLFSRQKITENCRILLLQQNYSSQHLPLCQSSIFPCCKIHPAKVCFILHMSLL